MRLNKKVVPVIALGILAFVVVIAMATSNWSTNNGNCGKNRGRGYGGGGFGRKTLKDVCSEIGIPLNVGISRLKEEGIDATENETVRGIASKYQLSPADLWDMLANGGIADE